MNNIHPKVFVSYSWSTPEHESFVIGLAEDLVESGVDVIIDKWSLQTGQDSLSFMESMISDESIQKVLIISDRVYADKANNRAGGVGTETQIISPEIYASATQTKFVMVTTEKDDEGKNFVPTFYKGRIFIDMSDANLYTESFERILRWIYDKPVHKKPVLGKRPSYLDDSPETSLGTTSYYSRVTDAIRNGKNTMLGCFDEYLSTLNTNLERIRYSSGNSDPSGDFFLKNIESFIPVRNEFINVVSLVTRFNLGEVFSERLHAFFEGAVNYYFQPKDVITYDEFDFDNYKFLIHELYLYTVALYLKHQRFDDCSILFNSYYVQRGGGYGGEPLKPFTILKQHVGVLELRNRQRNLRRLSLHADLLKERCHGVSVSFTEINQADFLCYIKSFLIKGESYMGWWPATLLYSQGIHPFEIFAKSAEPIYFEKIKNLLGVDSGKAFLDHIEGIERSNRVPRWQHETISIAHLSNAHVIAGSN